MSSDSFNDLINKAKDLAGVDTGGDKGTHPYFAPSDEPLNWDTKGKMVRLDVAIYALHIFAARIAFRSFSGQIRRRWTALKQSAVESAIKFAISKAKSAVATSILGALVTIRNQHKAEEAQKEIEAAIRRQSVKAQRECLDHCLGAGKPRRRQRTKLVMSRHWTPYQRKPNKSWRPT